MLSFIGIPFDVASADVDESLDPNESPRDYVLRLAEAKARALARNDAKAQIIIGSDTAVVDAGETLGKPRDKSEAESMLRQLRGRTHQVYTGIALYDERSDKVFSELCISDVPMRDYSDAEMDAYISTGDPMDKAGGYAIQNGDFAPVEHFDGCFASVMGFPLCHLARSLKKEGIEIDADLPQACSSSLNYECKISDAVLHGDNIG
ncbi:MAG: septum formation protein Maf [Anaerolineae bacterium]|nr:septum formation protein Maf [Anaerolineae bacterium]MBT7989378.1 septum formation protein Maf [Anaerolineae bacterium]